jgi:hypothetical protein
VGSNANTYRRHLGNEYRVILLACSTAGEVLYGKNIAKSLSDGHEVVVEGSDTFTQGGITINADGEYDLSTGGSD